METNETAATSKIIYSSVIVLILFALLAASARNWIQSTEDLPSGDSAWTISIVQQVVAMDKGATLSIPPPWDTQYARMYAQSLSHNGLRQKRTKTEADKRDIVLVAPKAGSYETEAIFSIHVSSLARSDQKKLDLSEHDRSRWLSASQGIEINTPATIEIVEQISRTALSPDVLIEKLFDHVSNNIRIKRRTNNNSETVLSTRRATALGSNRTLVALLRTAHLPARIVTGVNLQVTAAQQPYYWTEVYSNETWVPLDPVHGHMNQLPAFYIPMRKGGSELVMTNNATINATTWKIEITRAPTSLLTSGEKKFTDILDLNRLSPGSRESLGVLLLLPLGVLLTELLRQLLGVRTYGTFTPTLLALAIIHVDRLTAVIIFLIVTIIGVSIRSYLQKMKLPRTPLLGIVFTLVAISMTFVVSGFMYFDPRMDAIVVLLPVVILTMLVDRIYSIADQRGVRTAMIRLLWTAVAAILSLLVLLQAHWSHWLVTYPELHALTLAAIILVGRCNCLKISQLTTLIWLHEPKVKARRKKTKNSQTKKSNDSV